MNHCSVYPLGVVFLRVLFGHISVWALHRVCRTRRKTHVDSLHGLKSSVLDYLNDPERIFE